MGIRTCGTCGEDYDADSGHCEHIKSSKLNWDFDSREGMIEFLQSACNFYTNWYDSGHRDISAENIAYELFSSVRRALAYLEKN